MSGRIFSRMYTVSVDAYNTHGPEHYEELLMHSVLEEIELQGLAPMGRPKLGVHRHVERSNEGIVAWVEFTCSWLADVA